MKKQLLLLLLLSCATNKAMDNIPSLHELACEQLIENCKNNYPYASEDIQHALNFTLPENIHTKLTCALVGLYGVTGDQPLSLDLENPIKIKLENYLSIEPLENKKVRSIITTPSGSKVFIIYQAEANSWFHLKSTNYYTIQEVSLDDNKNQVSIVYSTDYVFPKNIDNRFFASEEHILFYSSSQDETLIINLNDPNNPLSIDKNIISTEIKTYAFNSGNHTYEEIENYIDPDNYVRWFFSLDDLITSSDIFRRLAVIREFFGLGQLSQFMDQTNPLSTLMPQDFLIEPTILKTKDCVLGVKKPTDCNPNFIIKKAAYNRNKWANFVQFVYDFQILCTYNVVAQYAKQKQEQSIEHMFYDATVLD